MKMQEINVAEPTSRKIPEVGKGKIVIDSGAAQSMCPTKWMPHEKLQHTDNLGSKYRAVGGQFLVSQGEKPVNFGQAIALPL